ncbi:acyl-CoA carboxylase subunit beta [Comamonas composti]|uniref:acyl-CoA carboxylase subunit beta n=1 Tax=Comamonas composti TaxID=408558 RepID=UPI0004296AF7|nr:carboxyl transferase domain-containing protein [Comamonas composti]
MNGFESRWNAASPEALQRREAALQRLERMQSLQERAAAASARSRAVFEKRGQLLPRQRIALLLDGGQPWLPLASLAGYLQDTQDEARSVPGGGVIAGIGVVSGVRCMVVASDSGIDAGAMQPMGLEKLLRAQELALANKLPFVHLVESAGANLMQYRVEGFVQGGQIFRNLARLSAAGLPVITVQHGSGTAGGAYMPGLSDIVIMVEGRSRAFLAGPPLLKAATGEIATEEELGGAMMHATTSGLGEYLAADDREALQLARSVVGQLGWDTVGAAKDCDPPVLDAEELLGLMAGDLRQPVDMREVMARLADASRLLEFKALYGPATVCVQAHIGGHAVGLVSNNGPIDVAGANKATHFIQWMNQLGQPLIYLQNTTGFMVGKDSEQGGMIKHGSKMIQAVSNARVPQITVQCGASFGAGNYGMCGRAYAPDFLFSWPGAKTAVMGGEQAARTMQNVTEAAMRRKGLEPDEEQMRKQYERIVHMFERQADVFYTSGLLLDDGVIDPRSTREVLRLCLDLWQAAKHRELHPMQFGVARM